MKQLRAELGEDLSEVFKSITTDNGDEFSAFSQYEKYMIKIYFAHPYSAWERPINQRTNRMLRKSIPKGKTITDYTDEKILHLLTKLTSLRESGLIINPQRNCLTNS